MISLVESFLYLDKQGTPEECQRIQQLKRCNSTYYNKDEDNSPKNHSQNDSLFVLSDETDTVKSEHQSTGEKSSPTPNIPFNHTVSGLC